MTSADWFRSPSDATRPTPLYWWSGADLDRPRLREQLHRLAAGGVGGTIVGYSHLPDGSLDHGAPTPLSEEWWETFEWFVDESASLGMTVGLQDYGIIGGVLRSVAGATSGLHAATLEHVAATVTGPGRRRQPIDGARLVGVALVGADGVPRPATVELDGGDALVQVPAGTWTLSAVLGRRGIIGTEATDFDPLHPASGSSVVEAFQRRFERLGARLGTTFTTLFQDELDLGLQMPMWNDAVAEALAGRGFPPEALHALWHEGPAAIAFRAAYRDVVVGLLESHYFRPVFEWHDAHGVDLMMDQLSRGDLRLGHRHYADFMATMRWYHGPGNDDPDLTAPRNVVAFVVSASIARHSGRSIVLNEAFHSSGWGVVPADVIAGANVGFVSGANAIAVHGLNLTTDGGWWEWASPDFHFRQPWWGHSAPLWRYLSRVAAVQRRGVAVHDVAVVDPTEDLDLALATRAPEAAHELVGALCATAVDPEFLPQERLAAAATVGDRLVSGTSRYAAVVLPSMRTLRRPAFDALRRFSDAGGVVIVLGDAPQRTEEGPIDPAATAAWLRAATVAEVLDWLDARTERDVVGPPGLRASHRVDGATHRYLLVNDSAERTVSTVSVRAAGRATWWDLWSGEAVPATAVVDGGRTAVPLGLEPGAAALLVVDAAAPASTPAPAAPAETVVPLEGVWSIDVLPVLDNRWGDFADDAEPIGVETWHVAVRASGDDPWRTARVGDGTPFAVLGPVPAAATAAVERALMTASAAPPDAAPVAGSALQWRPYRCSLRTGLADDPLLLDRMTGPHGLKGVPDEFLDPAAVDEAPPAGSSYYFWSTVEVGGTGTPVTASGRAAHRVWVGGEPALPEAAETAAAFFPPWGLRDLHAPERTRVAATTPGRTSVVVRVDVSAEQPTRVGVALGPVPPVRPRRSRLRWWDGPGTALEFASARRAVEPDAGTLQVRAALPPGAIAVRIDSVGVVADVVVDGVRVPVSVVGLGDGVQRFDATLPPGRELCFSLAAADGGAADLDLLTAPLRWTTATAEAQPLPWEDWGLADFSGMVRYRTTVELETPAPDARLVVEGLSGSVRVLVNDVEVGFGLVARTEVAVGGTLHGGTNRVELEVANSLANHYRRWPSPYARMQPPHGGFAAASIRWGVRRSAAT